MTELIWDGKYDKDGKRVAPVRVALPFQTVETVNESAQLRQHTLDLFSAGRDPEWRNRLIWGDKKYVLPSLLPEFAGQVNLIYIDPPFNVGADFSYTATIPEDPEDGGDGATFTKQPSVIEQKAYRDTWGRGLDSYLQWFYETVVLLRELLTANGSIYVHLDWHMGHYAKVVLDEVLSAGNFRSEIIWQKIRSSKAQSSRYGNVHDVLLFYSASQDPTFSPIRLQHSDSYLKSHYRYAEAKTGRRYRLDNFTQAGPGPARRFNDKELSPPPGKHWIWSQERIDAGMAQGLIVFSQDGMPSVKRYLDEVEGNFLEDIWADIPPINSMSKERVDYPTQKPEALLDRILRASSNEGDLVLDCFCGSGTTAAVAEKLNRRWIACDLGRFAIHTTRKRLLGIENVRPFVVQNLGKYERQAWQAAEFSPGGTTTSPPAPPLRGEGSAALAYRRFILDLFHARPLTGYTWLHGVHGGRMVHVGPVDSPISNGDVTNMVAEFKRAMGSGADAPATNGIDVLGWDFAFELNEVARQQAALAKVDIRFLRIPRDVMDKRAVDAGDIRFFELAALAVDAYAHKQDVTLTLTDFTIPPDDVPEEIQKAITHWSQWIDYWAVDWDNRGDAFHNQWQTYRTRKMRDLLRSATHQYDEPGEYTVVVKVIDILGNDTTKTLKVEV
jgi:DNA modification methylase